MIDFVGTFSFGPSFVQPDAKGKLEKVLHVKAQKIGSTKVRHLRSYGEDVDWIGTKECISCIGKQALLSAVQDVC